VLQISKNRNSVLRPVKNSRSVLRQSLTHRRAAVVRDSIVLGYNWLKDYNSKVDWKKGEVEITRCSLRCEGGCILWKERTHQKRTKLRALRLCHDRPTPLFQEELELEETLPQMCSPD